MTKKFIGLTDAQVDESRKQHGSNKIREAEPEAFWKQFLAGFKDPMIRILCVIAIIMLVMFFMGHGEWYEPVGTIIAVLLVNFVSAKTGVANDQAYKKLKESQKKDTAKNIQGNAKTEKPRSEHKRKLTYKERMELQTVEADIARLEEEKTQLEEALCSGALSVDELTEKSIRLPQLNAELDEKMMRWMELSEIGE